MAVKRYNGTSWEVEAGSQGIVYSATAPTVPVVGDIWVSTADVATFDTSVQTGFRNVLINGTFDIDQRNSGASHTITAGTPAYTLDRWYASCTGANLTGVRSVTLNQPDRYAYQINGAASNTGFAVGQRIESDNCYHFGLQTATLSVRLLSTLSTITWTAYRANNFDSFGTLASPTRTEIATGTFSGVTTNFQNFSATFVVPELSKYGIEIVFSGGALTSGVFVMTAAQLELGSTATPFEYRPIGTELALCQRYYQTGQTGALGYTSINAGTGAAYPYPVPMRTSPNFTSVTFTGAANTRIGANYYINAFSFMRYALANATGTTEWHETFTLSAEL